MDNNQTLNLSEQEQIRRQKLAALQEAGCDPFQITKYHVTHHSADVKASYDALEGQAVSVAGRMMAKRIMGKASFCQVQDLTGILQIYGRPATASARSPTPASRRWISATLSVSKVRFSRPRPVRYRSTLPR